MAVNRVPYRTSLRVLGRLLNGDKARMVTICELEEGFLLHYCIQDDARLLHTRAIHWAEVLDLDDMLHGQRGRRDPGSSLDSLQSILGVRPAEALRFQKNHPLCPMGYEEFLRALGAGIDRRGAQAVLITELEECMHIEYTVDRADFVLREGQRLALPGRREERYKDLQIEALVRTSREQVIETVRSSGQTLAFNPMDLSAYLNAASALEDEGQDRDAEELYKRAQQLDPDYAEIYYHLGRHARRRGDQKAALKHTERALALRSHDPRFLHLMGRLHMERNRFEAAAAVFEKALANDPGNTVYRFDLDRAYNRLGITRKETPTRSVLDVWTGSEGAAAVEPPNEEPDTLLASQGFDDVSRSGGRRSAHSLSERLSGYDEPEPIPYSAASSSRTISAFEEQELPPPSSEPVAPPDPSVEYGDHGMPILNLAVTEEWTTPTLPELHVSQHEEVTGLPSAATSLTGKQAEKEDDAELVETEDAAQLAAAIQRAEELVNAEPHRADLHRRLGFLLAKQGRSDEAAAAFRRAVECGRRHITGQ